MIRLIKRAHNRFTVERSFWVPAMKQWLVGVTVDGLNGADACKKLEQEGVDSDAIAAGYMSLVRRGYSVAIFNNHAHNNLFYLV